MIARSLRILVVVLCLAPMLIHKGLAQETTPRVDNSVIGLTLESSGHQFSAGEPIRLRATIRNTTSTTYSVLSGYVAQLVALTVRNSSGAIIAPQGPPAAPLYPTMSVAIDLPGNASRILPGLDGTAWQDLSQWGYAHLPPGTYTVTGVLTASVRRYDPAQQGKLVEHFATGDANGNGVASSVTFTVLAK